MASILEDVFSSNEDDLDKMLLSLVGMPKKEIEAELNAIKKKISEVEAAVPLKGNPGEKGEKGDKGDKGDKGEPGLPGKDGYQGSDGKDGKDGINGVDGKDGVSITDVKIDFDGHLVVYLSDGNEIDAGVVGSPFDNVQNIIANYLSSSDSGTGDVSSSSTTSIDNALARFDGTTGKVIQNSVATLDDSGNLAGVTTITNINYVDFNTGYATTLTEGQLGWNGNDTLGLGMKGGHVIQHIGEDQFFYCKATSAITKGQVVMFTGAVGASGVPTGAPATGITDGTYIMGIAAESIALNGFGLVQTFGTLRNVNTSGYADGDILWYNPAVAGGLTKTKPVAPNIKAQMAAVINGGSVGGGTILIRINPGSILGGTDSNAEIGTASNGQIITYDGADGYWKNTTLTAGTAISVSASSTGVLTINNSSPMVYPSAGITVSTGSAWGTSLTAPTGTIVGTSDTQTLTNKRVNPRVLALTSNSATPSINTDNFDTVVITNQSSAITSFSTNLTGTPVDGQKLWISITGTTAIALTWGSSFESSTITLPTTTVSTNRLDVGFIWNVATSKWRCVGAA